MNPRIIIDIDDADNFIFSGDTDSILRNRRLFFSLKRLQIKVDGCSIHIPFEKATKVQILQELQVLLKKYSFESSFTIKTKTEVANYDREQSLFNDFIEKARDIRNDKFKHKLELIKDFDKFQKVLAKTLVRPLYPMQLLSSFHMAFSQNACNFSVPGSGKTTIVYGAYIYLKSLSRDDPKHVDKLLVIGPLSSFAPWEKEYFACFGHKPLVKRLSGDNKISKSTKEEHLFSGSPSEITLLCHAGINNLQSEILSFLRRNKTMVVIDEAHRIKNPEGIWGKSSVEIAKEAISRIILTGTPVPNGYEDLFNLFQFLYPFKYKDILRFHYANLVDMTRNSDLESDRVRNLIDNVSPYFIRIKKSDLNLPPYREHVIEVEMDQLQREIYDFIESKYIKSFMNNNKASLKDIFNKAKLIRLRQAATNPSLLGYTIRETLNEEDYDSRIALGFRIPEEFPDDSQIISMISNYYKSEVPRKFIKIKELLEGKIFHQGGKALIWTIFIQNAKDLQKYLANAGIISKLLIGEVEQVDRESIIEKFNDPKNIEFQVVIANPFSISESISLHKGCHNAIYMERDYNCSNFLQSKDRIHRYGLLQNQQTDYYYLLSKESIDGVIHARLIDKTKRMEQIINEDIPLFSRINDSDETDLINSLIKDYARRSL